MAILIFFILTFLIGLPFGQLSRISPNLTTSFTLLDILVGIGSIVWIGKAVVKKEKLSKQATVFIVLIGIFCLSLIVNIWFLPLASSISALLYIVRWTIYGTIFFMAKAVLPMQKELLKKILVTSGLLLLFSGYIQFFFYPSLQNLSYEGWDIHFYRMFGTFLDPNFFGLFLVEYLLFLVFLFIHVDKQVSKLLLGFIILFAFVGIVLSYSRTSFIALGVGLVVLLWQKAHWKKIMFGLSVLIVIGFIVMSVVGRHAEGNDLLRLTSSGARIGDAKNALVIFLDNPLFGVGFNAYRYAQYKHHFMMGSPTQQDHGASGADASLLLVLATTGIVGFSFFIYFWKIHVHALLKANNQFGLATLSALMVGSLFINGLFYPSILVWLWIILGITEKTLP